ncbi:MAG: hypothetical protein LBO67_08500 [Spirochaetaceae bacterium]|nr:hypothetical protein [Spirochaetaceae bacterium]
MLLPDAYNKRILGQKHFGAAPKTVDSWQKVPSLGFLFILISGLQPLLKSR